MASSKFLLALLLFSIVAISSNCSHTNRNRHPLDPLSGTEFSLIKQIVLNSINPNLTRSNLTFHYVGLQEPEKPTVLSWLTSSNSKRTLPPRRALEQTSATELPFSYGPFLKSVRNRGLNITSVTVNFHVRPIEGVTVVVDLDQMRIVSFVDWIRVPVPKGEGTEYRASQMRRPCGPSLHGATILTSDGPGFTMDGNTISNSESVRPSRDRRGGCKDDQRLCSDVLGSEGFDGGLCSGD
ncbi:hypothetical protein ACFE04_016000 [Oxalis oulophora]